MRECVLKRSVSVHRVSFTNEKARFCISINIILFCFLSFIGYRRMSKFYGKYQISYGRKYLKIECGDY